MEQKILSLKDDKINSEVELFEYPEELRGGRNYFRPDLVSDITFYSAGYIASTGNGLPLSFYMSVKGGEVYTISRSYLNVNGSFRVSFTEEEPNKESRVDWFGEINKPSNLVINSIKVPDNANFMHIHLQISATAVPLEDLPNIKIEKGTIPTDWSPAPEDLNLSYPDFITEFKPSISDRYILMEELIEYPEELRGGRNLIKNTDVLEMSTESIDTGYYSFTLKSRKGDRPSLFIIKHDPSVSSYTLSYKTDTDNLSVTRVYYWSVKPTNSHIENRIGWETNFKSGSRLTIPNNPNIKYIGVGINGFSLNSEDELPMNFWDWKLEKGSKATDWTPAPEDLGLSYPDHTQSFGTSFSDKSILIREFKEQERIMIDLDFNKLELGSFNETKPEGSSFQECKHASIRYTRYNELIKTDGEFEITVDEGFGVNMLFFDENQKYIGRTNGYTGLQAEWFRGDSAYIFLIVGTVPLSNLEGVINPNIKITKLI